MTNIEAAAMHWFSARARRLEIGREKREAAALEGFGAVRIQLEISERLSQARRIESTALRQLAKTCAAQRGVLDESEIIDVMPQLVME